MVMLMIIAMESSNRFSAVQTSGMLKNFLAFFSIRLRAETLNLLNAVLRKCGHVLGYGFLSFLLFRACRGTFRALAGYYDWRTSRIKGLPLEQAARFLWQSPWALVALGGTALTAIADEMHQKTIPSRTGSWWDVLLDTCAGLIAQMLIFWFAARKMRQAAPPPRTVHESTVRE